MQFSGSTGYTVCIATNASTVTLEEINEELERQCAAYRYFIDTDDIQSWEDESQKREACLARIKELQKMLHETRIEEHTGQTGESNS